MTLCPSAGRKQEAGLTGLEFTAAFSAVSHVTLGALSNGSDGHDKLPLLQCEVLRPTSPDIHQPFSF